MDHPETNHCGEDERAFSGRCAVVSLLSLLLLPLILLAIAGIVQVCGLWSLLVLPLTFLAIAWTVGRVYLQ